MGQTSRTYPFWRNSNTAKQRGREGERERGRDGERERGRDGERERWREGEMEGERGKKKNVHEEMSITHKYVTPTTIYRNVCY